MSDTRQEVVKGRISIGYFVRELQVRCVPLAERQGTVALGWQCLTPGSHATATENEPVWLSKERVCTWTVESGCFLDTEDVVAWGVTKAPWSGVDAVAVTIGCTLSFSPAERVQQAKSSRWAELSSKEGVRRQPLPWG